MAHSRFALLMTAVTAIWLTSCGGGGSSPPATAHKDIENEGYFSGCFSYNKNTASSGKKIPRDRTIYVCDFRDPNDSFSQFIIQRWREFQAARAKKHPRAESRPGARSTR